MLFTHRKLSDTEVKHFSHPWENIVKPALAQKIKYAHNSVNNVQYPKTEKDVTVKNRIKFVIIGNRATKEFIYCSKIVMGLHKYQRKSFDPPLIRGVTSVEWPHVLKDIQIQYGGLAYCLQSQVAVIINDKFLGGEKELKETIEANYHYNIDVDYHKEGVDNFINFITSSGRPCVYMHISINEEPIGALIFMLYSDIVPYTCENFLRLCRTKKGGYSGTPVHRIVKNCWIQCGGYGLKSSDLDCENFIVQHDRRGVLGMTNDGRNVDCSTQFFVLLQPAPWMAHKYVAFGQLIDGEETLKQIESVPTWYESPTSDINIFKAGILNLECEDIVINKGTTEYINSHIEDLIALGEVFYTELLENVFTKENKKSKVVEEQTHEHVEEEADILDSSGTHHIEENLNIGLHATKRFLHKKEDIIHKSRPSSLVSETTWENIDFDVEEYNYEYEASLEECQPASVPHSVSLDIKPQKPYYIPLTDVPYPEEVESTFDLKKFLKGDYCLESDLQTVTPKKVIAPTLSYTSEKFFDDDSELGTVESLDSEDEEEIKTYLKFNVDRVSFAGSIIKNIARGFGKCNLFENARKSELITDEELRRFRLASIDYRSREFHEKKVSISVPNNIREPGKIKRRPTGFVRAEDLEKIRMLHRLSSDDNVEVKEDESEIERKVRIAPSAVAKQMGSKTVRRLTAFEKLPNFGDSEPRRPSVLQRLYDSLAQTGDEPTLKGLMQKPDTSKNVLLTQSPDSRIKSDENTRDKYLRQSMKADQSYEQVLNFRHGKKAAHKISSDYVKTIDEIEHNVETSLRSVEFAKTRPSMSVTEYQQKNRKQYEDMISATKLKEKISTEPIKKTGSHSHHSLRGIRLPGDTPLYSMVEMDWGLDGANLLN